MHTRSGDIICSNNDTSTLCQLVSTDANLDEQTDSFFTLFAPTNDAFDNLPDEISDALAVDSALLPFVLQYHVTMGKIRLDRLLCGGRIEMLNLYNTTTRCDGDRIFQVGDGNTPDARPELIATDIEACNGLVHLVDEVILPLLLEPPGPPEVVGTGYCTYSPDYRCYENGWPACCDNDPQSCPSRQPGCDDWDDDQSWTTAPTTPISTTEFPLIPEKDCFTVGE